MEVCPSPLAGPCTDLSTHGVFVTALPEGLGCGFAQTELRTFPLAIFKGAGQAVPGEAGLPSPSDRNGETTLPILHSGSWSLRQAAGRYLGGRNKLWRTPRQKGKLKGAGEPRSVWFLCDPKYRVSLGSDEQF